MTSNLGSKVIQKIDGEDFDKIEARAFEMMRNVFKPEFLNRIDDTIVFLNLSMSEIFRIIKIQFDNFSRCIASNGINCFFLGQQKNS